MTPQITVTIQDRATPFHNRAMDALAPDKLAVIIGPPLHEVVRNHLSRNPRNKRGWPSTGFWEDAARATTLEANGAVVTIKINKLGVRQRYFGGPIRPVSRQFLTIPIASQAYGKTVADFPGAFLITTIKGAYIVQYGGNVSKTGRGVNKNNASIEFLFKLVKFVTQPENKAIIPDDFVLATTALKAVADYLRRVKAGGVN